MKKLLAGAVLTGLLLRAAVLAGAGDAAAEWLKNIEENGKSVTAGLI